MNREQMDGQGQTKTEKIDGQRDGKMDSERQEHACTDRQIDKKEIAGKKICDRACIIRPCGANISFSEQVKIVDFFQLLQQTLKSS